MGQKIPVLAEVPFGYAVQFSALRNVALRALMNMECRDWREVDHQSSLDISKRRLSKTFLAYMHIMLVGLS